MKNLWDSWSPTERATLCFVVADDRILLIRKKRGLGAGKVNGPGGRIEPGESPEACAVRETQEELGITPGNLALKGELHFQFVDGYALHCLVYRAASWEGNPVETDEAVPLWTPVNAIPFDEMWADDRHWLPGLIDGNRFRAFFEFDGEVMLSKDVQWESENQGAPL